LKPSEVAEQLAVSRAWVYDAARTGRIPSVRIGGDDGPLRFVPEDIERWLAEARAAWLPAAEATRSRRREDGDANRRRRRSRRANPGTSKHLDQQSLL
jgi:excisionase family DNA binding protein